MARHGETATRRRGDTETRGHGDTATRSSYLVRVGLSYPPGKRAEPGDVVDDIPAVSLPWLLACGALTPIPDPDPAWPLTAGKEG